MKKSLVALAALAASAAFAQSTVTLSGTLDAGLEKQSSTTPLKMTSGALGTTNFTFSGSEDLGNGLKANFKVSTSFDSTYLADGLAYIAKGAYPASAGDKTLATPPVIGNNDMWVELAGGFGSAKLGRSTDPVFATIQTANSTKGVTGFTSRNGVLDGNGVYIANQFLYTTPVVSGLSAQVSYGASELVNTKANTGYSVNYAAGPLSVGFASSTINNVGASGAAAVPTYTDLGKTVTAVSGSYDAGVAKFFLTGTNRSEKSSSYNVGVTVPMGAGLVWADYTSNMNNDTASTQLGYKYSLSKRTTAYAQVGVKRVGATATAATTNSNGYGVGIAHNF